MGNFIIALYIITVATHRPHDDHHHDHHHHHHHHHHLHHHHQHTENFIKCLNETQTKSIESYTAVLNGTDPETRCVMACTLEKDGIMVSDNIDADEIIRNIDHMVKKSEKERVSKIVKSCVAEGEETVDKCDKANMASKCIYNEFQKLKAKRYETKPE